MISLSINELSKSYGVETILEDISFTVNKGDKIGLIGKNGSGKTTLFKILSGQLLPDKGDLYIPKGFRLGYLEQTPFFDKSLTIKSACLEVFRELIDMEKKLHEIEAAISAFTDHHDPIYERTLHQYALLRENFEKMNGYGYRSEIRGVLIGLGFTESNFDKPVETLSGGQKSRLNIAKLLLGKPDILLLDEPTNHLDIDAINWLEGYLKNYENSVLLISHDRYFIDQVANRIFELENKNLLSHDGQYTDFVRYKKSLRESQMKQYVEAQKEMEKQQEIIRRFKQHGTEKLAKRAASREKKLQKLETPEKPEFLREKASIRFSPRIKSGKDILFAKNLSKNFDGMKIFEGIHFDIYRNEKIGLIGPNGVGKTTLFKIMLGELVPDAGEIKVGHNVHFGYYDQELGKLDDGNNMIEEIASENPHLSNTEIRTMLGSFLFYGDDVFKKISSLSGGEKSRISLLKLMQSESNLLLLDEPTNHLDIPSKEALEDALNAYEGTLIAISHDRYFLNRVCDRIFVMSQNMIESYLGNYDDYLEKKQLLEELKTEKPAAALTKTQIKEHRRKQKEEDKLLKEDKNRLLDLESRIAAQEEQKSDLEHQMCQEEIYSDFETMQNVTEAYKNVQETLKYLYEEWESLI